MITSIFSAIAAVPQILKYVETFANWLSSQIAQAKVKQAAAAMNQATTQAQTSKDTSGIDHLFDPGKKS